MPRPDPRISTDLGPYRIEAVIGRGGMGVVYRAEERRLKRRVALKILPPELADDADFRARFERESQMAAAIDDPNILPIYEADEVDGILFIAMRYVEGTDLEARLRDGAIEPREAVRLLGQVASALDAAHVRGLVHRDVKPGNILIAQGEDERGDHAYLTDFGLTKLRSQDTSLTRAGAIMGTLDYMAPEQLEGREVEGAADQYALAAIAHRALTGRRPYERDSDAALITAILRDPPPSAHEARADLPEAVDAVLARGMAKKPSDRFTSCAAFMSELRSALGVTSSMPQAASPTPWSRSRWLTVTVAGIAVILVAVVGMGYALSGSLTPADGPSPSVGAGMATASPDPSGFPNVDEAAVLALLPTDVAIRCKRGSYDNVVADGGASSRPLASLACTLPGRGFEGTTPDRVTAIRLRDSALVTPDRVVDRAAAEHDVPDGDCAAEELPATGPWAPESAGIGRVACWIEDGDAVVEWSHERDGLVFRVARGNRDEGGAIGLWQSIGFAVWAAIRGAAGGVDPDAYPNAAEAALLGTLPDSLTNDCVRGPYDVVRGDAGQLSSQVGRRPSVSLSCRPAATSGANIVLVRSFQYGAGAGITPADFNVDQAISRIAQAAQAPGGDCATSKRANGRWQLNGLDAGAIVCYQDTTTGDAILYWSYPDARILVKATNQRGDSATLYDWFEQNARFIAP